MSLAQVLFSLGGSVAVYVSYKIYGVLYRRFTSPIRHVPGLSSTNIFIGNMKEMMFMDQAAVHEHYARKYGTTFTFKMILCDNWLLTADVKAISHILKNDAGTWQKPVFLNSYLRQFFGPGIIMVEADDHKKQRKILNPAFSPAEVKSFTSTFLDKAVQLRDIWMNQVDGKETQLDVLSWLTRTTLDIIGETGFGYKFNALDEEADTSNELHEAFKTMFNVQTDPNMFRFLWRLTPAAKLMPADRDIAAERARETISRIGKQLLHERELALDPAHSEKSGGGGNDILSLLVRANASADKSQRLPEDQVLAQIPTFLVAGHETTSNAVAWALFSISQDPLVQETLRKELLSVPSENPRMEELNALPYLDAVVREVLRLHPPVPGMMRVAAEDDILPLHHPVIGENGKVHHELRVLKGQTVFISLALVNQREDIWGKDASKFNPDRWKSPPEAAMSIPGVWGNILSFWGGPRSCIGYRFSLVEIKVLLFTLIRAFEFELAVPASDIIKRTEIVSRPILKTDKASLNQLPMLVRPVVC